MLLFTHLPPPRLLPDPPPASPYYILVPAYKDKTRETQQSTAATGSNTKNPVGIRREKGNDSCGAESSQLQVSSRHSPTAPGADTGAGTGPSDTKPVTSDSGASSSVLSEDVGVVGAGAGGVALAAVAVLQSTRELTPHMVDENDDGLFTVTVYRQYKKVGVVGFKG